METKTKKGKKKQSKKDLLQELKELLKDKEVYRI
jgi:hypothetical protein